MMAFIRSEGQSIIVSAIASAPKPLEAAKAVGFQCALSLSPIEHQEDLRYRADFEQSFLREDPGNALVAFYNDKDRVADHARRTNYMIALSLYTQRFPVYPSDVYASLLLTSDNGYIDKNVIYFLRHFDPRDESMIAASETVFCLACKFFSCRRRLDETMIAANDLELGLDGSDKVDFTKRKVRWPFVDSCKLTLRAIVKYSQWMYTHYTGFQNGKHGTLALSFYYKDVTTATYAPDHFLQWLSGRADDYIMEISEFMSRATKSDTKARFARELIKIMLLASCMSFDFSEPALPRRIVLIEKDIPQEFADQVNEAGKRERITLC
jgi:hypothetical protein